MSEQELKQKFAEYLKSEYADFESVATEQGNSYYYQVIALQFKAFKWAAELRSNT